MKILHTLSGFFIVNLSVTFPQLLNLCIRHLHKNAKSLQVRKVVKLLAANAINTKRRLKPRNIIGSHSCHG